MVDAWHALHHLLVVEQLQGLEVEMSKALVPPPVIIIVASCKTHRLRHLHIENIKAIGASVHLGEESPTAIIDAQYFVLDLHTRAILIQLSQADDGVPQHGDVVDTGEHPVLAGLGGEDDGADALDLHGGGVTELDGALYAGVQVRELTPTSHMVGGAGVEVPAVDLVITGLVPRKAWARGS